jgi:hypothetical protein
MQEKFQILSLLGKKSALKEDLSTNKIFIFVMAASILLCITTCKIVTVPHCNQPFHGSKECLCKKCFYYIATRRDDDRPDRWGSQRQYMKERLLWKLKLAKGYNIVTLLQKSHANFCIQLLSTLWRQLILPKIIFRPALPVCHFYYDINDRVRS